MPQSIIRYRTKPGQADANAELPVAQAFTEMGSYRFFTG